MSHFSLTSHAGVFGQQRRYIIRLDQPRLAVAEIPSKFLIFLRPNIASPHDLRPINIRAVVYPFGDRCVIGAVPHNDEVESWLTGKLGDNSRAIGLRHEWGV